jgi:hypothetical protein
MEYIKLLDIIHCNKDKECLKVEKKINTFFFIILIILIIYLIYLFKQKETYTTRIKIITFTSIVFILIIGFIAYKSEKKKPVGIFIHGKDTTNKIIKITIISYGFLGFLSNIISTIMMNYLDFDNTTSALTRDGIIMTYSLFVFTVLQIFIKKFVNNIINVKMNDAPIWSNSLGIIVGYIFAIIIKKISNYYG